MTTPMVSVVIAAYNAEDYVAEAVRSVLEQTMDDLELIVVNDGSTDSTRHVLRRFEDDQRVQIIDQENTGCSAARNRGAAASKGRYIAIVDADDVCWSEKLERQVELFRREPGLAVVGTQARMIDQEGRHLGVLRTPTGHDAIAEGMRRSMQFCHPTVLIRGDVYRELGGYEESYPTSEDYEFLRRIIDGYRAANVDDVLYDLRIHGGNKSFYYFEQQRLRGFLTRHMMDQGRTFDDETRRQFEGDLSKEQLVAQGICGERIDRQMVTHYVQRVQMLDRLGHRELAKDFMARADAYIERHQLEDWAQAELRALRSLRALRNGRWRRSLRDAMAAMATEPGVLFRRYMDSGRYTLHRWRTRRELERRQAHRKGGAQGFNPSPRSTSERR